jgi:transmembrane sensor
VSEPRQESSAERIEREAAAWVLARDRGLTPGEQDAFSEWLAADPRHGAEWARHRRHWQRLDQLADWRPEHGTRPNPDLLAPPLRSKVVRFLPVWTTLAAAAAVVLTWALWPRSPDRPGAAVEALAKADAPAPIQRVLEDGTLVELNQGAELSVNFTPTERRVTLERGEAYFAVTKNQSRPFLVRARGLDVRAVGTAFNVRVDAATIEVLVAEGRVLLETQQAPSAESGGAASAAPLLEARQRAVVPISEGVGPTEPQVATLTTGEVERVLAWQHRRFDFTVAPLDRVVAEFNRRNLVQLIIVDPELAALRVTASLRSDNVEGFVRLLEAGLGVRAERRGDAEILLRNGK